MLDNYTPRIIGAVFYKSSSIPIRVLAIVVCNLVTISSQAFSQDLGLTLDAERNGGSTVSTIFSPDGKKVAISPRGVRVFSAAFSPDGKKIISRSPDGTLIAYLITTWETAGSLRRGTETAYVRGNISLQDYSVKLWDISRLEESTVKGSLIYFSGHGLTGESWQSLPELASSYRSSSTSASSFSASWIEMYRKRMLLEMDLARGIINEAEYHEQKQALLNQEQDLAKDHPLSESEMITYYEHVSRLPAEISRLKEALNTNPSLIVVLAPWGTASVALLAAILGFILSLRKDLRERREMHFKELQATETAARISQMEQSKDMELEELKLKIRHLEQQLSLRETKLIIPA